MEREQVTYRVKDKGGPLGGKEITFDIPKFNLEIFLKTPNADEFIKKAYYAEAKKIAREIKEGKNGSVKADLESFEMIVARSLNFTKGDINKWLQSRDWSRIDSYKNSQELRRTMEKHLPNLASRVNYLPEHFSKQAAEKIIAELSDKPDPIADFLFSMLTAGRSDELCDSLGF